MNREFIVVLLKKDIHELRLLTEGFERMNEFPEPILLLAKQKAENILKSLNELNILPTSELGEIDYQSFASQTIPKEKEDISVDKNNFDAPVDAELEKETEEPVTMPADEVIEHEKAEQYIEAEHELVHAAGAIDEDADNQEEKSDAEEVQEETVESEQRLTYAETDTAEDVKSAETSTTNGMMITQSVSLNDAHFRPDNSVVDEIANHRVDDIRQAMNIGDRFRFQRELFGGNGEVMNKTIAYLNQLAKYQEAESFLKAKFGWAEDNPHAEEFLQMVKRRY